MGDASDNPSFSRRYVRGELTAQFWNVVVKGVSLANSFLVLTALTVYQFGLYQLVLAAIAIADNLSAGLFDDVVVNDTARGLAEQRHAQAKRLFNEFALYKVIVGAILAALMFFGAGEIGAYYGKDIAVFLQIASFLVILEAIRAVQDLFFTASRSLSAFAIPAIQEIAKFLLLAGFIFLGTLGIRETLQATVIAAFIALLFASWRFLREYRRAFRGVLAHRQGQLRAAVSRYGTPVLIRYGFSRVTKNVRPWLIKFFVNTEAVALYTLAINLITLAQSVFPITMISRLLPWEAGDERRLAYIFRRSVKYVFWGGTAVAVLGFLFVPPIITAIFPKYAPAMPLFWVLTATLPFYGVYKIQKSLLLVLREQKILTARLVTESFLVIGLNIVLLPIIGVLGTAVEYVVTYGWRVFLFHRMIAKAHPGLRLKPVSLFSVDPDDRRYAGKLFNLLRNQLRRPAA